MNNVDFHTKNENHDLGQTLDRIHFRCPCCSKLYSSDPAKIYVEEPEYTCSKCKRDFSISLLNALQQSETVGVELKKFLEVETVELPTLNDSQTESTEVELNKLQQEFDFESLEKGDVSFNDLVQKNVRNDFESHWGVVMASYESRDAHNKFISFCKEENELDFAIEKYASLVGINPNDKIASSFLKRIQFILDAKMKFEVVRERAFFTKSVYITMGIVFCGFLLIAMGTFWLQNKNIAGLGLGLIFFTFAARAFFQPRSFGN